MDKRIQKNPERLVTKIMNNQTKGGWKDITNKIKTSIIGEQQTQTITTMNIKTKFAGHDKHKSRRKNQNTISTKQHNMETWY